jgi:uncharacterized protein (DUF1800 family)
MMHKLSTAQARHLLSRAGFGGTPEAIRQATRQPLRKVVRTLLADAERAVPLALVSAEDFTPRQQLRQAMSTTDTPREQVLARLREQRQRIGDLNAAWLERMGTGEAVLREKLTLFWHGHFACMSRNPYFVQQQNNTLRQHALGTFGDLLRAVAKDPAMLQYLNNQQNRKGRPNENFAREVMELFTLGRGHYTEHDVKEAARAFTGWGFDGAGQFVFRENQHDAQPKTVFGKTGTWGGDDVIDFLLSREETAQFVTRKLYRFLVNEQVDEARVAVLAQRFFGSGYQITPLLEEIFTSNWFYEPRNIGARIKSPVELLAGMQRNVGVRFGEKQAVLFVQKALDQVLFYPPNVAGWPGGTAWIDSSSLLLRMKLPELIFNAAALNFRAKEDGDVNTEHLARRGNRVIPAVVDWAAFEQAFAGLQGTALLDALAGYLLPHPLTDAQKRVVQQAAPTGTAREWAVRLMTLPEYQLC